MSFAFDFKRQSRVLSVTRTVGNTIVRVRE